MDGRRDRQYSEDGTENDEPNLAWVSDTPTEEREVLFLCGNLADDRTASASIHPKVRDKRLRVEAPHLAFPMLGKIESSVRAIYNTSVRLASAGWPRTALGQSEFQPKAVPSLHSPHLSSGWKRHLPAIIILSFRPATSGFGKLT